MKGLNYLLHGAVLPPEAEVGARVTLGHYGMGIVVHPNVRIGNDVVIWHGVTLAVSAPPGSAHRIDVRDGVTIGAGAVVISRFESSLTIGEHSVIGANAVVTHDVPERVVVAGNPGRVLHSIGAGTAPRYR